MEICKEDCKEDKEHHCVCTIDLWEWFCTRSNSLRVEVVQIHIVTHFNSPCFHHVTEQSCMYYFEL